MQVGIRKKILAKKRCDLQRDKESKQVYNEMRRGGEDQEQGIG